MNTSCAALKTKKVKLKFFVIDNRFVKFDGHQYRCQLFSLPVRRRSQTVCWVIIEAACMSGAVHTHPSLARWCLSLRPPCKCCDYLASDEVVSARHHSLLAPPKWRKCDLSFYLSVYSITAKVIGRCHWKMVLLLDVPIRKIDLLPDTDSGSLFHFRHYCWIGDFRRFISISHNVTRRHDWCQ